jgi:hypothetical protein
VSGGFGEQHPTPRFEHLIHFAEESLGIRQLMNHRKDQNEIHAPSDILSAQALRLRLSQFNATFKMDFPGATSQRLEHLRLNVNGNDATFRTHETSQFQREETHAGAGFQYGHPFRHVRRKDLMRILSEAAKR